MDKPLVSILMPAFNASLYIQEACSSLLRQSYSKLEIIIVDDCSTDDTINKIRGVNDSRIHLLRNNENMGLAASLNIAIRKAKGKYFARMDADDICYSNRIQEQVDFLERNQKVSLLGTGLKYFNYSNYKNHFPVTHELCKAKLLFNVCFGHSSLMFRSEVFDNDNNLYNPVLRQYSEDYELYSRLVDHYSFSNLQKLLIRYRTFEGSIKEGEQRKRKHNSRAIRRRMLLAMGVADERIDIDVHCKAADLSTLKSRIEFDEIGLWFEFLAKTNSATNYFDQLALNQQLSEQLFEVIYQNFHLGIRLSELGNYTFYAFENIPFKGRLKYLIKKLFYAR